MKINIILLVAGLALITSEAAGQCDKLPADFNVDGCCKFPNMTSDPTSKKVRDSLKDEKDELLQECKFAEALFKELKVVKDNAFDKDAMLKQVEGDVKEANWKPVVKAAADECIKTITAKKDDIAKALEAAPFNIKKDQCNVLFMSVMTCIHLEAFEKCPKESFTDEKKCNDARAWVEKCGDKLESLKALTNMKM